MAVDKKISGLDPLTQPANADLLVIVDDDEAILANQTKNITAGNFFSNPLPIGNSTQDTGQFTNLTGTVVTASTNLTLAAGATVTEFSIDGTLGGNSDAAVPTEKAVKTYVDAQIATTDDHNELNGIQGGDSTNRYHLDLVQYNGLTDGGSTDLHSHSVAHNNTTGLQGGSIALDEYYHLDAQTYNQISSDATSVIFSGDIYCDDLFVSASSITLGSSLLTESATNGGLSVTGDLTVSRHAAINADIDYPGFPTYEAVLRMDETFGSGVTGAGYGLVLSVANSASNAGTTTAGLNVTSQVASAAHLTIQGGNLVGNTTGSSAAITNVIGLTAVGAGAGDNATVTNMIASELVTNLSFGMVGVNVTNMYGSKVKLLNSGSGEVNVTNAYGVNVLTPGFTSTGTITNLYGIYVEDQSTVGFTNAYNFYSAGASSENVFEGNVTVQGTLTAAGGILSGFSPNNMFYTDTSGTLVDTTAITFTLDYPDGSGWGGITRDRFLVSSGNRFTVENVMDTNDYGGGLTDIFIGGDIDNYGTGAFPNIYIFNDGDGKGSITMSSTDVNGPNKGMLTITNNGALGFYSNSVPYLTINATVQTLGYNGPTSIILNQSTHTITMETNNVTGLVITPDGITLENGFTVNEISNDGTLSGDSTSVLVTEQAIKAYVNTQISAEVITGQESLGNGDSTASITFVSAEADTNYSIGYSLVNTVDSPPSIYASIVTEKTVDGFTVTFSGPLDSANYTLDWSITR